MPYYYHSDEPSKVEQVTGERTLNFKHPLLLMNGTRALAHLTGRDGERQAAVHAGRTMSAIFGAACVATLAALAWLELGLWGALCVSLVVAGSHGLFTYAHFMKEDTAVAFGLSAVLLGAAAFARRPGAATAAALGGACALAISGKYVGAVALVPALPLVWYRGRRAGGTARALGGFALGLAAVLAIVNVSVLVDFAAFRAGLAYETDHVATGGGRPFAGVLSLAYWHGLVAQTTWPVRILAAGWLIWVLATWRRRSFGERALALFPIAYLALLQASPIKAIRYLLPVVVALYAMAGFAIASVARGGTERWRPLAAAALLAVTVAAGAYQVHAHLAEFAGESRTALYEWVRKEVPSDGAILQDRYSGLPDPSEGYFTPEQPYLPQMIVTKHYAVDYGTYDELVARGIGWVAVCDRITHRFFTNTRRFGDEATRAKFERRRDRYAEIFARGQLVFQAGHSLIPGAPVNPVVSVYRIGGEASYFTTPRRPSLP
jgi:hypothetical protein